MQYADSVDCDNPTCCLHAWLLAISKSLYHSIPSTTEKQMGYLLCWQRTKKKILAPYSRPKVAVIAAMSVDFAFHMRQKIFADYFSICFHRMGIILQFISFQSEFSACFADLLHRNAFFAFEKSLIYCLCKLKIFFLEYFMCVSIPRVITWMKWIL